MGLPCAKRFTTSSPIIAISTLCAPGFLRPFEKENPFCYRRDRGKKRKKEESHRKEEGEQEIWHGVRNTLGSARLQQPACTSLLLHLCMYGHVHLSIWTIVCLPESKPEWHSCSKRTPTGSGICDSRGEKPLAYCSLSPKRKTSLGNHVEFTFWPQFRGKNKNIHSIYLWSDNWEDKNLSK